MRFLAVSSTALILLGLLGRSGISQIKLAGVKLAGSVALKANAVVPSSSRACTAYSTDCTSVDMTALPYASGGVSGYADPSMKADPQTRTLWMAFSFFVQVSGTKTSIGCAAVTGNWTVIATYLLYSTDNGDNWSNSGLTNGGALFPPVATCNGQTGKTDMSNSEVIAILPEVVSGTTYWHALRLGYLTRPGATGGASDQPYTNAFLYTMAAGDATHGPQGMTSVTPQAVNGSAANNPHFPVTNLTALSGQLSSCTSFREPELRLNDSVATTLDVYLQCTTLAFYPEFHIANARTTFPNGVWTYQTGTNTFATGTQAQSLCSYTSSCNAALPLRFTELNISRNAADSANEWCASLVNLPNNQRNSTGVVCGRLATTTPPAFLLSGGNIVVDATVTSADSISVGPGSSTYAPTSTGTGIVLVHKYTNCTAGAPLCSVHGGFFSIPMGSGLLP